MKYGGRDIPLSIPDGVALDVVGRRDAGDINERAILREALAAPLGAPDIATFLKGARAPLVIVNDHTRSTPTGLMLTPLLPALSACPGWRVIVATGLHRGPSPDELRRMFGDVLDSVADRLLVHNARDSAVLTAAESVDGPIQLNRVVFESDRIVILTSVEPHFFAGYTGGRKSFIPGLSGADTIQQSHAGAMFPIATPLVIEGNPVRRFIQDNTGMVAAARIWVLQAVLDRQDRIAAAFAGDIDKTFTPACRAARNYYAVPIDGTYDIVLSAIHPPLDENLYQAQKGWEHSLTGVRDGGALIIAAACHGGIGSPFYAALGTQYPDPTLWSALEAKPYTMGLHKLVRTARANARVRLMAATDMPV
ncbi:MAG TPA: lactate racemase domain-containing protein, partial [Acidobacteriota bacterium]|nr:lactate racemase domain-containing protein [Acidobacteriota bacterium]